MKEHVKKFLPKETLTSLPPSHNAKLYEYLSLLTALPTSSDVIGDLNDLGKPNLMSQVVSLTSEELDAKLKENKLS